MNALIVAFDGALADTASIRIAAILKACEDENITPDPLVLRRAIAGNTIAEAVEILLASNDDPVARELVSRRAERHCATSMSRGVSINPQILDLIRLHAGNGSRVVIRADSSRSQVESQLALAGIEHMVSMLFCGDDPAIGSFAAASNAFDRNWEQIRHRLDRHGIQSANWTVVESGSIDSEYHKANHTDDPDLSDSELAAYEAAQRSAAWFETDIRWSRLKGPKAAEALNGLVTNDVALLAAGTGCYAAALTPKGKLICDMMIACNSPEDFSIGVSERGHSAWIDMVRKYVNPRLAKLSDEVDLVTLAVTGPDADKFLPALQQSLDLATEQNANLAPSTPDIPPSLPNPTPWCSTNITIGSSQARLTSVPVLGNQPCIWITISRNRPEQLEILTRALDGSAVLRASHRVAELLRIEAGWPAIGVDMNDTTIPQEANLDSLHAISFNKGCYTGQETVARVHFRGHVNKHLRAVSSTNTLPPGTRLVDIDGKTVGEIRSSAVSPRFGPIAIAMVRREVAPGSTVFAEFLEPRFMACARVSEMRLQEP